jgi:endonuclease YncB( thermonuclease family)
MLGVGTKHTWLAVLLLLAGACAALETGADTVATGSSAELAEVAITAVVVAVADGDSFRAESAGAEFEVRLLGVNAPESDECYGPEATTWLRAATDDREVGLDPAGEDQFGRMLARVLVDGVYLNREAVSTGHALVLSSVEMDVETLLEAERGARRAGLGLWGEDICGATAARASLAITRVDHDPPGPDETETVTIENVGTGAVELQGFQLRDESSANRFRFPSYELLPGRSVTVVSGSGDIGSGTFGWRTTQPVWNNDGDTALVLDAHGRIVAAYRYPPR